MTDTTPDRARQRRTRLGWAAGGLLIAGGLTGGLLAVALPAQADPSPSPSASASASASAPAGNQGGKAGAGGQRTDETVLTGTDAEKARTATLKAVPGATIDRVETDADGAVYEAHVTKSDGTKVTVKFDKDFNVTAIQDGMGSHK